MTLPSPDRLNSANVSSLRCYRCYLHSPAELQPAQNAFGVMKQEEGVCGALASSGEVKDAILRNLDLYSGSVQPIRRVSVLARSILSHKVFNKTAV